MFEIREVSCPRTDSSFGWTYNCQATLLTRDPRYQKGAVVVWCEDVTKDANGKQHYPNPLPVPVVMVDGVATLTGGAYYTHKSDVFPDGYDSDPGVPQAGWKISVSVN